MMYVIKEFEHLKIQLEAIKSATNNFSEDNCIGKGGFGKVYKGELVQSTGRANMVSIKRLDRAFGQGDPQFWKEIIMLSLYRHENIVSLLGFCDDSGEKILVYEYSSKRSLDLHLNTNDLTWVRRLRICIGAARGLAYLHNPDGTQQRVLHRDIKSSNILLDEDWNARISDLGLSKFGPANQRYTFLVSHAVGTVGYCDPLYVETGLLTKESDVYSLGVVLFEVLCGRLSIGIDHKRKPLIGLVRRCYEENTLNEIIYGNIKDEINPESLSVFTTIAYRCLKIDHEKRPLMDEIVTELETALQYQETELLRSSTERELFKLEKHSWPNQNSSSPSSELEQAGTTCQFNHLTIPNNGTDVWEIDPLLLILDRIVASGSYGDLYKGRYHCREVAIKILEPNLVNTDLEKEFAHEVHVLGKVHHKNVVQFIGACTKPPLLCIVTEFLSGGSVYDYLHKKRVHLSFQRY